MLSSFAEVMKKFNLVCIHGNSQNSDVFRDFQVDGCEKILINLPGHGGRKMRNCKSFLDVVDAVYHDVKGIPDLVLVGLSLGGHVAHHLLERLTPHAVFTIGAPPLADLSSVTKAFSPHPFLPYLFQNDLNGIQAQELARSMLMDRSPHVNDLCKMILKTSPDIRGLIGASFNRGEFRNEVDLLRNYRGRKVLIYPTKDNFVSENYIKSLNIAPVKEIQGAHVLTMDNPGPVQEFIRMVLFA
jgi:pimeloyl-ACP methyl ester carboxylesterase